MFIFSEILWFKQNTWGRGSENPNCFARRPFMTKMVLHWIVLLWKTGPSAPTLVFPSEFGNCKKLYVLDLDGSRLRRVYISSNKLQSLPPTIIRLKNLKLLDVSNNKIPMVSKPHLVQGYPLRMTLILYWYKLSRV